MPIDKSHLVDIASTLQLGDTHQSVWKKMGSPDDQEGSGIAIDVYNIDSDRTLYFGYSSGKLIYIRNNNNELILGE